MRTSAFSRGASSPSVARGSAASSASAMTRPSTRSPRNSSRWLSAVVAIDGCVSASTSSSGRAKRWPIRASAATSAPAPSPRASHSIALKNRSGRQVQKASIDGPAEEKITRSARPTRFSNGTKPTPPAARGKRESIELSRLSPMKKNSPSGTTNSGVVSPKPSSMLRIACWPAAGHRLDRLLGQALAALGHRPVHAARHAAHRPLRLVHLGEGPVGLLRQRLAVDVEHAVEHLHPVARQADQPLDVVGAVGRMLEDHDVAPHRVAGEDPALDRADRERAGVLRVAVGHLVDEQEVADQERRLHRPGRESRTAGRTACGSPRRAAAHRRSS